MSVRPWSLRDEVHLEKLARRGSAHDDVLEPLVGWGVEQRCVVQERDVDPTLVAGVGVHDVIGAGGNERLDGVLQRVDNESVLDLADPQKVRSGARVHLSDGRGEL